MLRKKLAKFGLVSLTIAGVLTLTTAAIGYAKKPPSEREKLEQWLKETSTPRPTDHTGISLQPIVWRSQLVAMLTLKQQEAVWKSQLESFVLPSADLTPAQLEARTRIGDTLSSTQIAHIQQVLSQLPSYFDESKSREQRLALVSAMCNSNRQLFSREQATAIFALVGALDGRRIPDWRPEIAKYNPDKPRFNAASVLPVRQFFALLRSGVAAVGIALPPNYCTCHEGSACTVACYGETECAKNPDSSCQVPGFERCGCLALFDCDAKCLPYN